MIRSGSEAEIEVAVIGAGAVGLACAAALAKAGRKVALLERHARPGQETSSRNSGVIHAGLYYPAGSLKARLCVRGRHLLYERCARAGIPHRRLGKVIVAVDPEEEEALSALLLRGQGNGVEGLSLLGPAELAQREPAVRARAALWSPESGIVEAHALLESYLREAKEAGALIGFRTELLGIESHGERLRLATRGPDGDRFDLIAEEAILAAGLESDRLLEEAGLDTEALGLRQRPCKGDYFRLASRLRGLCRGLVYPMPAGPGLGIHITPDLAGALRAGPDARYLDPEKEALGYEVDPAKAEAFAKAIRRYLPGVEAEDLSPDYAGIRPKLSGEGEPPRDFVIRRMDEEGLPSLIAAVGMESPGLTASEAVAEFVLAL